MSNFYYAPDEIAMLKAALASLQARLAEAEQRLAEEKASVNVDLVLRLEELEGWFRGILAMRPKETCYDEFAYQRMVTSFHDAAKKALSPGGAKGERP